MKSRFWQMWVLPARHAGHVPSQASGITVTRVADRPAGDAVAEGGDGAAHLVPEHQGRLHPGVHVAVQDVQVGAAEPGVRDARSAPDPEPEPAASASEIADGAIAHVASLSALTTPNIGYDRFHVTMFGATTHRAGLDRPAAAIDPILRRFGAELARLAVINHLMSITVRAPDAPAHAAAVGTHLRSAPRMTTITAVTARRSIPDVADHGRLGRHEQGRRLLRRLCRRAHRRPRRSRATDSPSRSAAATTCASRRRGSAACRWSDATSRTSVGGPRRPVPRAGSRLAAALARAREGRRPSRDGRGHERVWDLAARLAGKPLWRLLADMTPEQLVDAADLRYLSDALTRDEAIADAAAELAPAPVRSGSPSSKREAGIPATRPAPDGSATATTSCGGCCQEAVDAGLPPRQAEGRRRPGGRHPSPAHRARGDRVGRRPHDRREPGVGRAARPSSGWATWPSSSRCGSKSRRVPTTSSAMRRSGGRWRPSASPPASTA